MTLLSNLQTPFKFCQWKLWSCVNIVGDSFSPWYGGISVAHLEPTVTASPTMQGRRGLRDSSPGVLALWPLGITCSFISSNLLLPFPLSVIQRITNQFPLELKYLVSVFWTGSWLIHRTSGGQSKGFIVTVGDTLEALQCPSKPRRVSSLHWSSHQVDSWIFQLFSLARYIRWSCTFHPLWS